MKGWFTVHVRVNDSATGLPIPVRIRFEAGGQFLAPLGRAVNFPVETAADAGGHVEIDGKRWHYIDGSCEIPLPPGEMVIEVSRGPEYRAARQVVQLAPGQIALRLTIERWIDLRKEGWYSGDTRVLDLTPHSALLEGAGEDVAVINLLAHQEPGQSTPVSNLLAFSGQQPALQRDGHLVVVNTLNQHAQLGKLGLLNCHRVVFPLRAGDEGLDDWVLADWCDQAHRKKTGLVIWSDPLDGDPFTRFDDEGLAVAILGKVDAFEAIRPQSLLAWRDLLQAGIQLPLVSGSARGGGGSGLGTPRTYAQLAPEHALDYQAWIEAVRGGRTFVTNGPLLKLTVAGHGPGAIVRAEPGASLPFKVEALGLVPLCEVGLMGDGLEIQSSRSDGDTVVLEGQLHVARTDYYTAFCSSPSPQPGESAVFAQTSAIRVEASGRPFHPDQRILALLGKRLDALLARAQDPSRRAAGSERNRLVEVATEAQVALAARMNRD